MLQIIDLSYPHDASTKVPGHPAFELIPITSHEKHGRSNTGLVSSMHAGTHVDSPYHFVVGAPTIDKVPLDRLFGTIVYFELDGMIEPKSTVKIEHLKAAYPDGIPSMKDKVAIIHTGWMDKVGYGTPAYYSQNPTIDPETATWLVQQQIKCVGLDCPPDVALPGGPQHGDSPVHRTLLGAGIMIIENLINLPALNGINAYFCAMPIKLVGSDGGLTRAVAIVKESLLVD